MTSIAQHPPVAAAPRPLIAHRRFTVDEYYRMGEAGILGPEDRVELIDGEIVKMSPIGPLHAAVVERFRDLLSERLRGQATIRSQNPIRLSNLTEPEPDVAVVQLQADSYASAHPTPADVLLLIEVSDSTLAYDRDVKLPRYAAAGIPELWIVDLERQQVEQHHGPAGDQYRTKQTWAHGQAIPCHSIASLTLQIDDILG